MRWNRFDTHIVRRALLWGAVALAVVGLGTPSTPSADIAGTGRRPLVVVSGVTQQLPTADYISTVGGLTTNATAASSGDVQTTTATVSTTLISAGQIRNTGVITPPAISTAQNNYNPTGLSTAYLINQAVSGTTTITGLMAQPTGTTIVFRNTGTNVLTFANLSSSSDPANQFNLGTNWNLTNGSAFALRYSGSDWRLVGWAPGGTGDIPNLIVDSQATLGQVRYGVQSSTTSGTSNDIVLNTNASVYQYTGSADATYTGFQGGASGRILIIVNSSGHNLTLADETGSVSGRQLKNPGAANVVLGSDTTSTAVYFYDGVSYWRLAAFSSSQNGIPTSFTSSKNRGTITLAAGTGTASVSSGAICTCSDTTAVNAVKCAVSATTLTATGTGTDVISYLCF